MNNTRTGVLGEELAEIMLLEKGYTIFTQPNDSLIDLSNEIAQNLMQIQKNEFKPFLEKHFQILTATIGDSKKYDIEFGKVDVTTLAEEAHIQYEQSRAYFNMKKGDEAELLAKAARDKKSLADEV